MMNFDGDQLAQEFQRAFGIDIKNASVGQILFLVKMSKHIRGRCRSNAALKNYLQRNFAGHTFTEVDAVNRRGETYKALRIASRAKPTDAVNEIDDGE
jgi:hypothetical protein